ncbi:MAG TPA: hypothetical protein VGD91_05170, partial [Trebonia sp.]
MSTEDRLRSAARARTDLVRDIRPLELPDELPRYARPAPRTRRWLAWGAPVAAAALVTALALVLAGLRQASGPPPAPAASGPAGNPAVPASVPRYYVALDVPSQQAPTRQQAVVADDRTGRTLAVFSPPAGQSFTGVTAAADDRTFVLSGYQAASQLTTFYLLRVTPGAVRAARLARLPVKPLAVTLTGLALSPDGSELAVLFAGSRLRLRTYSLSSGAPLGAWSTGAAFWIPRVPGPNTFGLSWLADGRHLAFRFDGYARNSTEHLVTVRTLDVTGAGNDLLAGSRLVLQVPLAVPRSSAGVEPCNTSLAASGGTAVVCGAYGIDDDPSSAVCPAAPPSFARYLVPAGKT